MKFVLSIIFLVLFVSALPVMDGRPLWGWETKRDVIKGTGIASSGSISAARACELLIAAPVPKGWSKIVLASANMSDTIYI